MVASYHELARFPPFASLASELSRAIRVLFSGAQLLDVISNAHFVIFNLKGLLSYSRLSQKRPDPKFDSLL